MSPTQFPVNARKTLSKLFIFFSFASLTGCALLAPKVPDEIKLKHSSSMPSPVLTNFNEALACMDNLMLLSKVAPIYVSSEGLTNYTSDRGISDGGKEMLITALSQMSIRSNGVRYISYGTDMSSMLSLQSAHPDHVDFKVPDFFIRGGVTQHNKMLWNGQRGAGASYEFSNPKVLDLGTFFSLHGQEDFTNSYSLNAAYGTVTVDMSAGYIATLQNIPGIASANTLALESQNGKSLTGDISISDLGLTFSLTSNKTQDFNTLYRALIQVGSIEIIGKLQGIPYWRCLSNAGAVEKRDEELAEGYLLLEKNDNARLTKGFQHVLSTLSYYTGPIDGEMNESLQAALQQYQKQMGLLSSGLVNYETFRMMNLFTPTKDKPDFYWWQSFETAPAQAKVSAKTTQKSPDTKKSS